MAKAFFWKAKTHKGNWKKRKGGRRHRRRRRRESNDARLPGNDIGTRGERGEERERAEVRRLLLLFVLCL